MPIKWHVPLCGWMIGYLIIIILIPCGPPTIALRSGDPWLIGMGFDGAATFSGDKTGVQRRLKKLSPHALFVHCCCHVLQLASVHAANATPGIKHVYTTLMTLWKFFRYSPKRAESLKEIQKY